MTGSAHEASLEVLMLQSASIPDNRPSLACCCGRPSCAYLSHNNAALDGLEKDLRTAAQLGQVRIPVDPRLQFHLFCTTQYFLTRTYTSLDCNTNHFFRDQFILIIMHHVRNTDLCSSGAAYPSRSIYGRGRKDQVRYGCKD